MLQKDYKLCQNKMKLKIIFYDIKPKVNLKYLKQSKDIAIKSFRMLQKDYKLCQNKMKLKIIFYDIKPKVNLKYWKQSKDIAIKSS